MASGIDAAIGLVGVVVGSATTLLVERYRQKSERRERNLTKAEDRRVRVVEALAQADPLIRQLDADVFALMSSGQVTTVVSGLLDLWSPIQAAVVTATAALPDSGDRQLAKWFVSAANAAFLAPLQLTFPPAVASTAGRATAVDEIRVKQAHAQDLSRQLSLACAP